jgi:hypothetical protein
MFAKKSVSCFFSILLTLVLMLAGTPLHAAHATEAGIRHAKPTASGTGNCLSWANACTLQIALTGAVSGDEIWAMAGTHKPTTDIVRTITFQLKDGVAVYGGFAGTETARSQRNPATNLTILSGDIDNNDSQTPIITDLATVTGNTTNSYHVVTSTTSATLDGFTITAGNANNYGSYCPSDGCGGGMLNWNGNPTLTNLIFRGNAATAGGGMYSLSGNPTLTNVTFNGNSASWGGGMKKDGNAVLSNVTFSGNSADWGGGMYNFAMTGDDNPILTNVTFSGNKANNGGGMVNSTSAHLMLTNITFNGNLAVNSGGGMYNTSSNPAIRNTILWGNTAATAGAQIYNNSSSPEVSDSVIQGGCPAGSNCTNIITTDPKLGTLGDYGGFTQTIPILAGSSAIDTGAPCSAAPVNGLDQRGYSRDSSCDIGAYEYVAIASSTKDITSFSFASPSATGVITGTNIALSVPFGTNVTALVPTIIHNGMSISPNSGVVQNFTNPVTYRVTAADASTKDYIVTVTRANYKLFLPLIVR